MEFKEYQHNMNVDSEAEPEAFSSISNLFKRRDALLEDDEVTQKRVKEIDEFLAALPKNTFIAEGTPYANFFVEAVEKSPEAVSLLKERLRGKLVVDLGCGVAIAFFGLLKDLDIKGYVGVDKYEPRVREYQNEKEIERLKQKYKLEQRYISDDMLHFVATLPDDSVSYVVNGISTDIIQDNKYFQLLAREIYRTTEKGGILTGLADDVALPIAARKAGFIDVTPPNFKKYFAVTFQYILEKENLPPKTKISPSQ